MQRNCVEPLGGDRDRLARQGRVPGTGHTRARDAPDRLSVLAFPQGSTVRERPLKAGGRFYENTTAPLPYQAFGPGVAPATVLAARSAMGGLAAGTQDVTAHADKREGRCESWEG